jgi:hypothetical protein
MHRFLLAGLSLFLNKRRHQATSRLQLFACKTGRSQAPTKVAAARPQSNCQAHDVVSLAWPTGELA